MNGEVIESMVGKYNPTGASGSDGNSTINGTLPLDIEADLDAYRVQVAVALSCIVGIIQVGITSLHHF